MGLEDEVVQDRVQRREEVFLIDSELSTRTYLQNLEGTEQPTQYIRHVHVHSLMLLTQLHDEVFAEYGNQVPDYLDVHVLRKLR